MIMNFEDYAKMELDRIAKDEGGVQEMMNENILEIVRTFAKQGHSGLSASYAIARITRLLQFKPLSPLTGEEDEWMKHSDGMLQNKRCFSVFKNSDGTANYSNAKVFSYDGKTWFTNSDSCMPITFPFTVPDEPERVLLPPPEQN